MTLSVWSGPSASPNFGQDSLSDAEERANSSWTFNAQADLESSNGLPLGRGGTLEILGRLTQFSPPAPHGSRWVAAQARVKQREQLGVARLRRDERDELDQRGILLAARGGRAAADLTIASYYQGIVNMSVLSWCF